MKSPAAPGGAASGAPASRVPRPLLAAVLALLAVSLVSLAIGVRLSPDPEAGTTASDATIVESPAAAAAASGGSDAERSRAKLDAQIAQLDAQLAADPGDADGWRRLGLALQDKSLLDGDIELSGRAAEVLAKADALRPGDPSIITARALVAASRHDFVGTYALVEPLVLADPFAVDARVVLVDAAVELGRYDVAERTLDELGQLRPGVATLSRISYLRELQGDLSGALSAMRQASAAGTGSAWERATVHAFTGSLLLLQDRVDEADDEFDRALAIVPDMSSATAGKASVLVARRDVSGAVTLLEADYARAPSVPVAELLAELRGLTSRSTSDLDAFIDETLQYEADAGYDNALERADIAASHGRLDDALALAEQGHAIRPGSVFAAEVLAWVRYLRGDLAGALPLVSESVRLDSADLHQHVRAAVILHHAGDDVGAAQQLRRAFELAPWSSPSVIAEARDVAASLGIVPPASWDVPRTS